MHARRHTITSPACLPASAPHSHRVFLRGRPHVFPQTSYAFTHGRRANFPRNMPLFLQELPLQSTPDGIARHVSYCTSVRKRAAPRNTSSLLVATPKNHTPRSGRRAPPKRCFTALTSSPPTTSHGEVTPHHAPPEVCLKVEARRSNPPQSAVEITPAERTHPGKPGKTSRSSVALTTSA